MLPERISDHFLDLRKKVILPYTRERALFQDKWNLIPCAQNGGMYFYKLPDWKPHPKHNTERLPMPLTRKALEARIPTQNHNGRLIVDRYGNPAQFFAKELPLGLASGFKVRPVGGEPQEPKWNSLPYAHSEA
jgi:hypothetical protein